MIKKKLFNTINVDFTVTQTKETIKIVVSATGGRSATFDAKLDGKDASFKSLQNSDVTKSYSYDAAKKELTCKSSPTEDGGSDVRVWTIVDGILTIKCKNNHDAEMTQTFKKKA